MTQPQPTVIKMKDIRGRKIVGYQAALGPFQTHTYPTPAEAIADVHQQQIDANARLAQGALVGRWQDHTYTVTPDAYGWRLWCDGFSTPDYYTTSNGTRDEAAISILSHLASCVWAFDVADDVAFVSTLPVPDATKRELVTRFQWYRDYTAFKTQGYEDQQIRNLLAQGTRPVAA